jgi:hypothetical protein
MRTRRFISICVLLLVSILSNENIFAQKNIDVDSAVITGECQVPPGPEWINNAVMYQIYPQKTRLC